MAHYFSLVASKLFWKGLTLFFGVNNLADADWVKMKSWCKKDIQEGPANKRTPNSR
jgi:hypothetical protein